MNLMFIKNNSGELFEEQSINFKFTKKQLINYAINHAISFNFVDNNDEGDDYISFNFDNESDMLLEMNQLKHCVINNKFN